MSTPFAALRALKSLSVDDNRTERVEVQTQLGRRGLFESEAIPNFDELGRKAKDKDIISLDLRIGSSDDESVFAAQDLLIDNPRRPVYFLTNHLRAASTKNLHGVFFLVEKNRKTLQELDYIQASILTHHRCIYLARAINQFEANASDTQDVLARQLFEEAAELCFGLKTIDDKLSQYLPGVTERYRVLGGTLEFVCSADPQELVVSNVELKSLREPLIDFAIGEQKHLLNIPGVKQTPYLEQTIESLNAEAAPTASADPSQEVMRKYVTVDFPPHCTLNESVELKVQIKLEGKYPIDVSYDQGQDEVSVAIHISGDSFNIADDLRTIAVPKRADSEVASFTVQPQLTGHHYLFINFYREAVRIGTVIVRTLVALPKEGENG